VVFDRTVIRSTFNTSTSAVTENNYGWTFNSHPEVSHWSVIFDQWTIVEASVTFRSLNPLSSTGSVLELHTAIDFDNQTNLGNLAAIDDYGSSQIDVVTLNKAVTRSVLPCVKPDLIGIGGAGVARSWVDSAQPTVPFYGIRSICSTAVNAQCLVSVEQSIVYAFRNSI
jgi:hypothetical protein